MNLMDGNKIKLRKIQRLLRPFKAGDVVIQKHTGRTGTLVKIRPPLFSEPFFDIWEVENTNKKDTAIKYFIWSAYTFDRVKNNHESK